jgi:hypothetical protein
VRVADIRPPYTPRPTVPVPLADDKRGERHPVACGDGHPRPLIFSRRAALYFFTRPPLQETRLYALHRVGAKG